MYKVNIKTLRIQPVVFTRDEIELVRNAKIDIVHMTIQQIITRNIVFHWCL